MSPLLSGGPTFSFLEEFLLLRSFWPQWIHKSCPEVKTKFRQEQISIKRFSYSQGRKSSSSVCKITLDNQQFKCSLIWILIWKKASKLGFQPLVFWVSGHHDKRSIQDWGVSSITVLKQKSFFLFSCSFGVRWSSSLLYNPELLKRGSFPTVGCCLSCVCQGKSVYLWHVYLCFNGCFAHPAHVTSELDVTVGIDDMMPHVWWAHKQRLFKVSLWQILFDKSFNIHFSYQFCPLGRWRWTEETSWVQR